MGSLGLYSVVSFHLHDLAYLLYLGSGLCLDFVAPFTFD
jgi:hypothetical protein